LDGDASDRHCIDQPWNGIAMESDAERSKGKAMQSEAKAKRCRAKQRQSGAKKSIAMAGKAVK
jgi:hypothetical protein